MNSTSPVDAIPSVPSPAARPLAGPFGSETFGLAFGKIYDLVFAKTFGRALRR